jgi:hypothetical protein
MNDLHPLPEITDWKHLPQLESMKSYFIEIHDLTKYSAINFIDLLTTFPNSIVVLFIKDYDTILAEIHPSNTLVETCVTNLHEYINFLLIAYA